MSAVRTTEQNIQTGRQGGHVNTTGMSSQERLKTDAEVNAGRKQAGR